MQLTTWID